MPKEFHPVKQLSAPPQHILDDAAKAAKMRAMNDPKIPPQLSDKGQTEAELRRQRQAEALRANLARRKAQSRSRADAPTSTDAQDEPPTTD